MKRKQLLYMCVSVTVEDPTAHWRGAAFWQSRDCKTPVLCRFPEWFHKNMFAVCGQHLLSKEYMSFTVSTFNISPKIKLLSTFGKPNASSSLSVLLQCSVELFFEKVLLS